MRHTCVLAVHSFVDLITNSSSELFICNTDKTIAAVKELVEEIYEFHKKTTQQDDTAHDYEEKALWGDIFKEPELSPFGYNPNQLPVALHDVLSQYEDVPSLWGEVKESHQKTPRYKKLQLAEQKVYRQFPVPRELADIDWEAYQEKQARRKKAIDKVWEKYYLDHAQAQFAVINYFLKANGFSEKQIDSVTIRKRQYPRAQSDLPEVAEFLDFYYQASSYNMLVEKGDILLHSADDNSVPYEMWDTLCGYLQARHYHLG